MAALQEEGGGDDGEEEDDEEGVGEVLIISPACLEVWCPLVEV